MFAASYRLKWPVDLLWKDLAETKYRLIGGGGRSEECRGVVGGKDLFCVR